MGSRFGKFGILHSIHDSFHNSKEVFRHFLLYFFFFSKRTSHQLCTHRWYLWLVANDLGGKGCRAHGSLQTSGQRKWRCRLLGPSLCRTSVHADSLRETERGDILLEPSLENKVEGKCLFEPVALIFREATFTRGGSHRRGKSKFDPVFLRVVVQHGSTVDSK